MKTFGIKNLRESVKNISLKNAFIAGFVAVAAVFVIFGWYALHRLDILSGQVADIDAHINRDETSFASTTKGLSDTIAESHNVLSNDISAQQQNIGAIQQQFGSVQQQFGTVSTTVATLTKLSQTDPELLEKYSKVYFLNENYVPEHLTEIPDVYKYSDSKDLQFRAEALPFLQSMIDAAGKDGVTLYVASAYRSFEEQENLKDAYTVTYGSGTANSFSAEQGYSEHQLGTAVDLISPGQGGILDGFDKTPGYPWLLANAYKYGFELSYPQGNSYYIFEPWHWRFVGVKLATDLHNQGENFYDMDQRTIDTYLVSIFDPS